MKNLFLLLLGCGLLYSCGSASEQSRASSYSDFEVIIDTIQVDPGNEILMAGAEIRNPGVSADKKWFYSWDQKNFTLEIVDLENYKLAKKVYFDQEGPTGIGPNYFYRVDPFPNEHFGFEDYESYRIYDLEGKLIKKIKFDAEWINAALDESESFELSSVNANGSILAGTHFAFDSFKSLMYLLDLAEEKKIEIPLPEFEKLKKYKLLLTRDGQTLTSYYQDVFIQFQNDSLIISNTAFNDVYFYNSITKELIYKPYNYQLIPNSKQKNYKNETASEEEMLQMINEIYGEIHFSKFYWDEVNQKYYRFASEVINIEVDKMKRKVFMAVYDNAFNLIGEQEVLTFRSDVTPLFVKDGKVHFYLNMEDELGFIRIGLKN